MSQPNPMCGKFVRLSIVVYELEHPELYLELQRLPKGSRRTQRIKALASERLCLRQHGAASPPPHARSALDKTNSMVKSEDEHIAAAMQLMERSGD